MRRAQLGMTMFLLSEAVFFLLLILAFIYFRTPVAGKMNLRAGAFDTVCLLASSFTIWRFRRWRGITIGLGLTFLIGQGSQYLSLIREGITISQGLFGTTFWTLAGLHGLHVLIGVIALAIVPATALRVMALYWSFFAFLWLAIFLVIYVWSAA